jgi:hypothetical protein
MTQPNPEVSVTAVRTRTTVGRVESVMSTTLVSCMLNQERWNSASSVRNA